MKKNLALLLVSLLLVSVLTACGKETADTDRDSSAVTDTEDPGDASTDGSGYTEEDRGDILTGEDDNGLTEDRDTVTDSTRSAGVSYQQMLRNAKVHDSDGFLNDLENSVTPGSTF